MSNIFNAHPRIARPLRGGLGEVSYGNQDADPTVKQYQSMMNTQLGYLNYNPIAVDGKLGKQSCGCIQLFNSAPWMFKTTAKNWSDNLANQVDDACKGQPYTLPTPKKKADSLIETDPAAGACSNAKLSPADLSNLIVSIQRDLNQQLDARGYEGIPETGTVTPETCGAAKLIDQLANTGYVCNLGGNTACTSFVLPKKKAGAATPASSPIVASAPPAVVPSTVPVKKAGISAASMVTGGLLLAAAAGAYYYAKKKGMVG